MALLLVLLFIGTESFVIPRTIHAQSAFQHKPEVILLAANAPISHGTRITTIDIVNVRAGPSLSASVSGVVQNRVQGTIIDGSISQDGYTWWRIRYDNGLDGWTADKFIQIAAAGQSRQQAQPSNPWNPPFGGTTMNFFQGIWSLLIMLFWLGLIVGLIYAIVKAVKSIPADNFSHWYTLIENLQGSSLDFYQSLQHSITSRQVPQFAASRITWPEGGIFSARREYLRIKRNNLIFDICAGPFGNGFFVSWWLGPKPGFLGFIYSLPIFGPLSYFLIRPFTYYRIDTALMFQQAVHNAVLEVIDGMTQAKGLRALTESERKPVMKSFLQG